MPPHDLPVRAVGPHGNHSAHYPTEVIPPELRPVLTGTRPWTRLAAFMHLRDHPTLRAAAAAIPIDPKNLARYIRRLERELGQHLVRRAAPPNPITGLTQHGHDLANTIATALQDTWSGPHRDHPASPRPRKPVSRSRRGTRLTWGVRVRSSRGSYALRNLLPPMENADEHA
ncbi:LysR family transcriptional regulator [Lentzea sp. NPDC051838]|uniref:LysR family transcriptional regulator n=1 Tax=Lentzea sp. NPDC051838 TaxID=3154849 RepID=UPI0034203F0F